MGTYVDIGEIIDYWIPLDTLQCSTCDQIFYCCTICNKNLRNIASHNCTDELTDFLLSFLSEGTERNILTDGQIAAHTTQKWTPNHNQNQFLQSIHDDIPGKTAPAMLTVLSSPKITIHNQAAKRNRSPDIFR